MPAAMGMGRHTICVLDRAERSLELKDSFLCCWHLWWDVENGWTRLGVDRGWSTERRRGVGRWRMLVVDMLAVSVCYMLQLIVQHCLSSFNEVAGNNTSMLV